MADKEEREGNEAAAAVEPAAGTPSSPLNPPAPGRNPPKSGAVLQNRDSNTPFFLPAKLWGRMAGYAAAAGAEADPEEDFSDMESYGIITIGGTDKIGSPVFCFKVRASFQSSTQHFASLPAALALCWPGCCGGARPQRCVVRVSPAATLHSTTFSLAICPQHWDQRPFTLQHKIRGVRFVWWVVLVERGGLMLRWTVAAGCADADGPPLRL